MAVRAAADVRVPAGHILTIVTAVVLISSACSSCTTTPPYKAAFNTKALTSTLERGKSTESDVVAALGQPTGAGRAIFPGDASGASILAYGYTRADVSGGKVSVNQDFLLVFVRDGRYDGFLWFSDATRGTEWQSPAGK